MTTILFGYKKCSTCKKAEKFFKDRNKPFDYIDITEKPPSKKQLKQFIKISELPIKKWFNSSGLVYREMNLKSKLDDMSEAQMLELLASNGKLIKRPVVSGNSSNGQPNITVGFKQDQFEAIWD